MLLVMTVEPGFGGQNFMIDQIGKIEEAHKAIMQLSGVQPWLQVDGGITLGTIALAAKAGADTFVAGSAIYNADNPARMIKALREAASAAAE
jgi:ribulose-phosphate 3-epimerase